MKLPSLDAWRWRDVCGVGGSLAAGPARALVAAALCASLVGTPAPLLAEGPPSTPAAVTSGSPVAEEVWALLDKYYLDRKFGGSDWAQVHDRLKASEPLTDAAALDAADRLVRGLGDRYSRVLTPSQAGKLNKYDVTGVGINIIIADSGEMQVGSVPPAGSDADKAGIGFGDRVLKINGRDTTGMTSFDALEAIQAVTGDTVALRVSRGSAEPRDLVLKRAFTPARDPVKSMLVDMPGGEKAGYIRLTEFTSQCKGRVREALVELRGKGATELVLDLRGNGGGVLDGAIGIAGLFSEKPLVLFVTDANGSKQPLYSREPKVVWREPVEVWVDAKTASSAEVLAAALHDNCRARVVGKTTYGKGVIQGVFGLSDGGALVTTVASYATPAGNEIDRQGVAPDEGRLFLTEALGSGFVEGDVKQTKFDRPFECSEKLELDGQAKAAAPVDGTYSPRQPTAAPKLRTL